ncbi:MAG TPA: alpha/beta hydrolase-fold protein [Mucilaginibacter sp.]|nr:alpha/beta hydrolase-fold protein [Mucilaginibacter sp.]
MDSKKLFSPEKGICYLHFAILLFILIPNLSVAQMDSLPGHNDKAVLLHSKIMGEDRTLWIHLPDDYHTTSNTYPVLYLLDGEGHFSYASEMVRFLSGYDRNRIPAMIVVGIVNVDRGRDFTPIHPQKNGMTDSSAVVPSAGAGRFLRYIEQEVLPYVDAHYRVQPYRVLAGHSLGGLFAFYAKEAKPDLFPATILISPAINGVNDRMLAEFGPFLKQTRAANQKLFIGIGHEGTDKVDSITAQLKQIAPKWMGWDYRKYDEENHFSVPYKTLFDGLKFIYKDWFIDFYGNEGRSYQDIDAHFKQLSAEFGYPIHPGEVFLNSCGYNQLRANHLQNAIGIFAENVRQHPDSFNAYDSLGEAYMKSGNTALAILNYKKSLELNPHNDSGREMLKKLEANEK